MASAAQETEDWTSDITIFLVAEPTAGHRTVVLR